MDFHGFKQTWKPLRIITTEARDLLYMTCSTSYCLCNTLMDPWNMRSCVRARTRVCVCVYFLTLSQPLCNGKYDRQYPQNNP